MPHFLVILEKGEDWEIEHDDSCPKVQLYEGDPLGIGQEAVEDWDCLIGRIVRWEGIDDHLTGWNGEPTWRDLEPGKYEIKAWTHRSTGAYGSYEGEEAGLEFVDVDDRAGGAP